MTTFNIPNRVQILKRKFTNSVGLPFRHLLPETTIQEILETLEVKYRRRLARPVCDTVGISFPGFRCWQELSQCSQWSDCLVVKWKCGNTLSGYWCLLSSSSTSTLLDGKSYSTLELVKLYELRWDVELDLKHLKTTLGMDILRSKSPEMVRKEIYIYLLAYNLLRTLMWESGTTYGVSPLRLSLQGTRQHLDNFIPQLLATSENSPSQKLSNFTGDDCTQIGSRPTSRGVSRESESAALKLILEMQQPRSVLR